MKKMFLSLLCVFLIVIAFGQGFPGTDSLRRYNVKYITNNAAMAFTNHRLNTLLAGMIDWIDSARAGEGGFVGVDTIGVINDSTLRYRKNGVWRNVVIKGGHVVHDNSMIGAGTTASPLKVDSAIYKTRADAQRVTDSLVSLLALKLNISDTAAMLAPFHQKLDSIHVYTAAAPDPDSIYQYKGGDSTLVGLIPKPDNWGSQVVQHDITLTGDGTSGTLLKADTIVLSTRQWRQKGDDSVAAVLRQVIIDTAAAIRADFPTGSESGAETQLRKGIGADTSTGPPIPDTLLLEEEYFYTTADERMVVADIYVDDDQSDSNDGETETTAEQTITAATTSLISKRWAKGYSTGLLRANSIFREQFTPTVNAIRLGAWGLFDGRTANLPMISASDPLPSGGDTASMYKVSITHSLPTGNPGYDYMTVVEIDTALEKYYPYMARRYLTIVASIALCDATPGSFFQPSMTSPTPVYINPTEGNVGSNKYRYEIAIRLSAIYSAGYTGRYTNLWLENGVSGYGTVGGTNGGVSDIYLGYSVLQGSATHTSVIKSGLVEHNVYISGSHGGTNGNTGHVFYEGDGAGNYGIFRKNIMFDYIGFLLAHQGEGVNNPIEYIKFSDNYLFADSTQRGAAFGSGVIRRVDIIGNYVEHCSSFYGGGAWDNRIINNVFRDINGTSGVSVPSNLSRPSTVVDNLIEFFPPGAGAIKTLYSVNQNLHNVNFNHNTAYIKTDNPGGEAAQIFSRNSSAAGNTPFDVQYNIFISSTPSGTYTKVVTVDQNSVAGQTAGWVSDFNVYIVLSGSGFRWVVLNPSSGGPNINGLTAWQAITDQDDNSIEIDLTAEPNGLKQIFVDPENGNWSLTNSAEADQIRAVMAGKRNPPTFYPKRPLYDEAVTTQQNGSFKTPSEIWQYPNYAGGGLATDNGITQLTGDVTAGPGNGSQAATLANTTVTPGSYTNADITVDAKGRITAAANGSASGSDLDSTEALGLFHRVVGNNYSAGNVFGSVNGFTLPQKAFNINRGFWRYNGQWLIGDDSTGITDAMARLVVKSTTGLSGVSLVGGITGTNSALSIGTSHTATANNQTIPIVSMNTVFSNGGFTGVTQRPIQIIADYASGTSQMYLRNTASGGNFEVIMDGSNGQARITTAGLFWSVSGNVTIRPGSASFSTNIERSTGVTGSTFDSTGFHTGGSTRPLQKFRVSGNAYAASQGVTGAQAAFVAGVYQNTSTAAAGTVTHASVIGIAQSTLASTNSITTTNASTLYIADAPLGSSTNTITNPYALYVNAGRSFFGGGIQFNQGSDATGDIYYRASTGLLTRLGVGSNGNVLTLASGLPSWAAPASATTLYTGNGTATSRTVTVSGFLNFSGDNIGVTTGTSSTFSKVGGVLWDDFSTTATSGTSETDLYTYTTAANTLGVDGEFLEFEIEGYVNPASGIGGGTMTLKAYWAGTEIFDASSTSGTAFPYVLKVRVFRTSSTNARVTAHVVGGGFSFSGVGPDTNPRVTNVTTTFSGTNIIKNTGTTTNAGEDINVQVGSLKWFPQKTPAL